LRTILTKAFYIFDYIPDAIYYKDTDNNIIKVNDYYCKIVGLPKSEIENASSLEIFPRKLAEKYWKADYEVIQSKEAKIDVEEKWNTKRGTRYVLCSRIPIEDQNGDIMGILGIAKDINERKIAEQKLRESKEQFQTICNQSIVGICIIQDNQIKYVNNTLGNILGYTLEKIKNWDMEDIRSIIHPEDLPLVMEDLQREETTQGDFLKNCQYRVIKGNGITIWVDNHSKTITYQGRPADLIIVVDITENKMAQEELISLNKLRSELLSRTSHELKTPLVVIKGYTELLRDKNKNILSEESMEMIDIIDKGVAQLSKIIEQIMDASRVKAKKLKIHKTLNNLSDLIRTSVKEMDGLIKLRNHNVTLEIDEDLTAEFDWDAIFQVLRNLISNAIKFTPPNGNITIRAKENDTEIIVLVKDNGIGFEEHEKKYLFSEFGKIERFGENMDVLVKGSGLGLYISKYIIELHRGRIWMESEGRHKGSTFYFSLPISS
jgi:PAS domain S-box-containing protein